MKSIDSHKNNVIKKLTLFLNRIYLKDTLTGFLKTVIVFLLIFGVFSAIEFFAYFSSSIKIYFLIFFLLFGIFLFFIWIFPSLFKIIKKPKFEDLTFAANFVGNKIPSVKDDFLNSFQLIEKKQDGFSVSLIEAAFENIYNKIKNTNFNTLVSFYEVKKYLKIFLSLFIFAILVNIFIPSIANSTFRLFSFNKDFNKPSKFILEVQPGNSKIRKGESLNIKVFAKGEIPSDLFISTKSEVETEYKNHFVKKDTNNSYTLNILDIRNSFDYFAQKDGIKTNIYRIEVSSAPYINKISFEIIPPKYSKLPTVQQENNGNITALKGSEVNFEILSSKELSDAKIVFEDSLQSHLNIISNLASGSIKIVKDISYKFVLTDKENIQNESPINYRLKTIADEYPVVTIKSPEINSLLPQNDILSIEYYIKDDYGFRKAELNYKISESRFRDIKNDFTKIDLSISGNQLEQNLFYNWNLMNLNLKENETVSYFIEVFDNDIISGPKSTKTQLYKIRVPSLDELFAQAENTQNDAIKELTETLKNAEELQKDLKKIGDELKQNQNKLEWDQKERIEESVKKFEELKNEIQKVQEKLNQMQTDLMQNNLLSEKTMEKFNELQELMNELSNNEILKSMQEMQKSLQELMRDQLQNSLETFTMNEETFQKSIERTLNLLKRIQVEQKVDEIIKRTENILDELENLSKETNKADEKNDNSLKDKLMNEQKDISNQLDKLKDELNNLSEKMKDVNDMPKKEMDELINKFEQQNNSKLSQSSQQNIEQQDFQSAMQNQMQLNQNMNSTLENLQNIKSQMQQQNQEMVLKDMLQSIENIITLSKEQEKLIDKNDINRSRPERLSDMAKEQMNLSQNLNNILKNLNQLSQKTFAITPEMGNALGEARNNMNEALAGMQTKNSQRSIQGQSEAMKNLNEAASIMQSNLQQMMQGGGQGGGMMSLLQQLQNLAQQQMGLNQLTQSLNMGQLSMQQQAQLQKLAQEQGLIQKSLSELNKEARESGESKKIAANLEKILEDMEEVVTGMNTQKLNDEIINKQERILSKLLDAQRSINERDFEKKRESQVGKDFNLESPSELILNNEVIKNQLREELIKAINEGYSKDYEDLIRRYFELLDNPVNKN